jgi:P-type Cu+ transporter
MKVIKTEQDPVCGMDVDAHESVGKSTYKDKTYYFCGPDCKAKFDADPSKYAKKAAERVSVTHN